MLKKIILIILTLLLLVPPVQAHADTIVFESTSEVHFNSLEKGHHQKHHQHDTEEERNTDHHHHCTIVGVSSAIITPNFSFQFVRFSQARKRIHFYKELNTSSFLDELFQPPQI